LEATQKFNILFYGDKKFIQLSKALEPATSPFRLKAFGFVDQQSPRGSSVAAGALEAALAQQPRRSLCSLTATSWMRSSLSL